MANDSVLVKLLLWIMRNSSNEICNLSKILISRIQDISDSPRSKRDICDLERCSSATEHKLICLLLRTFLSVIPSFDFFFPAFPTKFCIAFIYYTIIKSKKEVRNEENFKTCANFVVGNGYHYYCRWIKYLGVHLLKNIIINRILTS